MKFLIKCLIHTLDDSLETSLIRESNSSIKGKYFNVWWNKQTDKTARYKIYKLETKVPNV